MSKASEIIETDLADPKCDPLKIYMKFFSHTYKNRIFSDIRDFFLLSLNMGDWEYNSGDIDRIIRVWIESGIISEAQETEYGTGYLVSRKRLNELEVIYD